MSDPADFLKDATIEYGGMRPDNGGFMDYFGLNTLTEAYWFTVKLEFAPNGNDFAIRIGLFGALGRYSATYKSFNPDEIDRIKKFLQTYFSSQDIPHFSAMAQGRRPFSLHYADDWVIEGDGELYERDGMECRRVDSLTNKNKHH